MTTNIFIIFLEFFSILIIIFFRNLYEIFNFKSKEFYLENKSYSFSFCFFSDLHEKKYGNNNSHLIDYLKKTNIDNLIIAGDMVKYSKRDKNKKPKYDNTIDFFKEIKRVTGIKNIFYGLGNHELNIKYNQKEDYNKIMNSCNELNVHILDDNYFEIDNKIRVYSISLYKGFYKKEIVFRNKKNKLTNDIIKEHIGNIKKEYYNIIICHNPDYSEELINYGFDLVLSGHHHGGLVRFPFIGSLISPELVIMPKYSSGLYKYKNKNIIVSNGLGEHSINFRLNNMHTIYEVHIGDKIGID